MADYLALIEQLCARRAALVQAMAVNPEQITDDQIRDLAASASLLPPMFLAARSTFCPSRRTPSTTSSEIAVALRSRRTRTTVPSRMRRMIGSADRSRRVQASQSLFTLRHTRLTTSLPTAPPKSAASARRTRRVLVPDR